MDYNTDRSKLVLPEYGRYVQEMVEYAVMIPEREERQRCASAIVELMAASHPGNCNREDLIQKLWNHIALISDYKLDIDYPVEIEVATNKYANRERVAYPQQRISRRHYGKLTEQMLAHIATLPEGGERDTYVQQMANQMKRALANWNSNAMNNDKVLDDIAEYTKNALRYNAKDLTLISDDDALAGVDILDVNGKKKKKKKK